METKNIGYNIISYVVIVILSLAFLYYGNRVTTRGMVINDEDGGAQIFEARVISVVNVLEHGEIFGGWQSFTFEAEIIRGERRGEIATFSQSIFGYFLERFPREAREGDRVILALTEQGSWTFIDYVRIYNILVLGIIFIALLIIFGRVKGLNSILALGLTCTAVFGVFIPSVLSGRNVYAWSIAVCVYSVVTTLFIINGANKKSAAAITGCLGGVVAAGLLTFFMNRVMELTGITQPDSVHLLYIAYTPIDLNAIIFASIIIGSAGAVMDMAVSISSSLWELKTQVAESSFSVLFKSGISIGKDILGSNINTLVLAYIGNSLTIILILLARTNSLFRVLNRELVIVELLQAIVGSFGIFLSMPLTALVCAALFRSKNQ